MTPPVECLLDDNYQVLEENENVLTGMPALGVPATGSPQAGLVWVIDDDPAVLVLFERLFKREGFRVLTSDSVSEALEMLPQAQASSLVILDVNIPGGTGFDVLRELRLESDAPVVMISNVGRAELIEQAFELGADDFVEKPFDPLTLLTRARRLVD